uniref:Uncharacterized protein n=1 Tax=Aegilops tauschii TaxID=37682 RepID=M8C7X3_AEGTA
MGRKRIAQTTTAKRATEECRTMTLVVVKGHCTEICLHGVSDGVPELHCPAVLL